MSSLTASLIERHGVVCSEWCLYHETMGGLFEKQR